MKRFSFPLMFFLMSLSFLLFISSCTTATYGRGFVKEPESTNQYSLRIYVGGFSDGKTADQRAQEEIKTFMSQQRYAHYKILDRKYNLIPSYFEYKIRFYSGSTINKS